MWIFVEQFEETDDLVITALERHLAPLLAGGVDTGQHWALKDAAVVDILAEDSVSCADTEVWKVGGELVEALRRKITSVILRTLRLNHLQLRHIAFFKHAEAQILGHLVFVA